MSDSYAAALRPSRIAPVTRQRDAKTRETKFLIRGVTLSGIVAETAAKLGPKGKLFIITVYVA
jgi:hypothetical protein